MPDRPRLSLAELPHRFRDELAALPGHWRNWRENIKQDPAALWQGPISRLLLLALVGTALLLGIRWLSTSLSALPPEMKNEEPTPFATLYVACTNPDCLAHYTTQQPMDFDNWPLTCEQCGQPTVYRATRCPDCRQWFATTPDQPETCPHCTAREHERRESETPAIVPREHSDDAEDPW